MTELIVGNVYRCSDFKGVAVTYLGDCVTYEYDTLELAEEEYNAGLWAKGYHGEISEVFIGEDNLFFVHYTLEVNTGEAVVRMVGDDRIYHVDRDTLSALDEGEFCRECGQIGCGHS